MESVRAGLDPAREPALPGWAPAARAAGAEPPAPLRPDDLDRCWHLDFHYPRGTVPLAVSLVADLTLASQWACRDFPHGPGTGLVARLVGPHVYLGPGRPGVVPAPRRAAATEEALTYPARFRAEWALRAAQLDATHVRLMAADLAGADLRGLAAHLAEARAAHRRAWDVHFAVMYRLLAVQSALRAACVDAGLSERDAALLLHGEDNAVLATDRELRALADAAREQGLAAALRAGECPTGTAWWERLQRFLAARGQRSSSLGDLTSPSWAEDPTPVLDLVRVALETPADHDAGTAARDTAGDRAAALRGPAGERVRRALADARRANFAWWNEEHNVVIDLRAHLPVRRAALAVARATSAPAPDAVLYLYADEVDDLLAGRRAWRDLETPASERRAFVAAWRARRGELAPLVGTAGDADPVLAQIMGGGAHLPAASGTRAVLTGLGVSGGTARGRVRVLRSADDLALLRSGEVLVCEATSPSWTPAFDHLAACVCDAGGMLTHAAIVSREYGVPCVCSVGTATAVLRDGDLVEVDGDAGTVTLVSAPR
jgi:phosphohistidine swiveling domain-containing protein